MIPLITALQDIPAHLKGAVVAVGNFDGVHRGHASLVSHLVRMANERSRPPLVITFDPPPSAILRPELPVLPPLTTLPRRAELLGKLGVKGLLAMPTSSDLLELSAVQFYDRILRGHLEVQGIVEGPNFRFGKDRQGDVVLLDELCRRDGLGFHVAESVDDALGMISSSRIRGLIAAGDIASANWMLTEPFQISGVVTRGAGRGTGLGFPTANIEPIETLTPAHGVYAGRVVIDGKTFPAAVNIGPNPTFGEQRNKVEIHIVGLKQDLYDRPLACDLLARVRDVICFSSKDELLHQINRDIQTTVSVAGVG
ncbi:MAG: riboflavin biosynthesis protein RibF [Pirellulales bacterium]